MASDDLFLIFPAVIVPEGDTCREPCLIWVPYELSLLEMIAVSAGKFLVSTASQQVYQQGRK